MYEELKITQEKKVPNEAINHFDEISVTRELLVEKISLCRSGQWQKCRKKKK